MSDRRMTDRHSRSCPGGRAAGFVPAGAFTLIELMVSIGIIALLVGILLPVIGNVRQQGYVANTQAFISQLQAACEAYQLDFRAYPGPLSNSQIGINQGALAAAGTASTTVGLPAKATYDLTVPAATEGVTGAENLVLGLAGGLTRVAATGGASTVLAYDPTLVGTGPASLNPNQPKKYKPYLDAVNLSTRTDAGLKTGRYQDAAATANDTVIPEFVDRFPNPMPVLYLRANSGANPPVPATPTATNNPVVTDRTAAGAVTAQYDLQQVIGYTGTGIGEGRTLKAGDYTTAADYGDVTKKHGLGAVGYGTPATAVPMPAYPYLLSKSAGGSTPVAKQKDGYLLIAAGKDRVYGTQDDITNFGPVQ